MTARSIANDSIAVYAHEDTSIGPDTSPNLATAQREGARAVSPPVTPAPRSGMPDQSTMDVFVGRQPIFDRHLKVVAYELLFRTGDVDDAGVVDGDQATSQVLLNTFTEIGLDQMVGRRPAFINFTRPFIVGTYSFPFPKDRVVMEIVEDITVDQELIEAVHSLARSGYRIALDDVVSSPTLHPLVPFADIVKLDILAAERACLEQHVETLRQHDVEILAEKVETPEDFEFCHHLGIDYFQGFFLSKPNVVRGWRPWATRETTPRVPASLPVLAMFRHPDTELLELKERIARLSRAVDAG